MSDPQKPAPDLRARLEKAQAARKALEGPSDKTVERYQSISGAGLAMRFATEFVAAVAVGTGIGILLDRWFKTSPLFLLIMFGFGLAAGVMGGIRAYRNFNAELEAQAADRETAAQTDGTKTP
ncbi:MAG: AtpZ/AtpI family protein [Pseudomonadota bacterium]